MNANELRIGNWVHWGKDYQIDVDDISNHAWNDVLQPIPLTEEWLLNFGFKKIKTWLGDAYENENGDIAYLNGQIYIISEDVKVDTPKYVHQLQNLYFALTGEELNETN